MINFDRMLTFETGRHIEQFDGIQRLLFDAPVLDKMCERSKKSHVLILTLRSWTAKLFGFASTQPSTLSTANEPLAPAKQVRGG
jgi:hypothetical protein